MLVLFPTDVKARRRWVIGFCLAIVSGPVLTIVAAEVALWSQRDLAIPLWQGWLVSSFAHAVQASVYLLLATTTTAFLRPSVPTFLNQCLKAAMIASVVAAALLFCLVRVPNLFYDRYRNVIAHATNWAAQYSEERFSRVVVGMTVPDVLSAAGEPIRRVSLRDKEVWVYSQIGQAQSRAQRGFHQRTIVIESGRVVGVNRRYMTAEQIPF